MCVNFNLTIYNGKLPIGSVKRYIFSEKKMTGMLLFYLMDESWSLPKLRCRFELSASPNVTWWKGLKVRCGLK